jgi:aryl-alcohol dehydrogenase-like predicted oxidoreductase
MYEEEDKALEALSRAIDLGITYIDTAHAYGEGRSEERIGRLMTARRKEVTLATKIPGRTAEERPSALRKLNQLFMLISVSSGCRIRNRRVLTIRTHLSA